MQVLKNKYAKLAAKPEFQRLKKVTRFLHYGEISVLKDKDLYPIYDVTASGITSTWHFTRPNDNRIEGPIMDNHFGLISIDGNKKTRR